MPVIAIRKGHNVPLAGNPEPRIVDAPRPTSIALQPPDFRYLRPRLKVRAGDTVSIGTPLFEDKDDPRIVFVSPGCGKVANIHYGERRSILEVIVELSGEETFEERGILSPEELRSLDRDAISGRLLSAGLWPMLRQRPFSRIARPGEKPKAIVVSATAADPFDPDPDVFLAGHEEMFQLGLDILTKVGGAQTHLCIAAGARTKALAEARNCRITRFSGPYPAGNAAVQIYHLCPPETGETVWYLSAQDALAIARSLTSGRYSTERIVSLAGSGARERTYLRTRLGASVESLSERKVEEGEMRYISGGTLTGRKLAATGFLGFYDSALNIVPEGRARELFGFLRPGTAKYSRTSAFLSTLFPQRQFSLDTNKRGSSRNFVMNGIYEDVCPVDIWPQHLAKSILAGDIEESEKHGILDCAECGLCTFVCPSKVEVGEIIRRGIDAVMKEG